MARIARRERRQRGFFGWIFLILFWLFNAFMLWWLVSVLGMLAEPQTGQSEAYQAGRAVGGFIGTTMIFSIWGAGAVILGIFVLLTRGSRILIEETNLDGAERYPEIDMSKWSKRDRERYVAAQAREREEPQLVRQIEAAAPPAGNHFGWRDQNGVRTPFSRAQFDAYNKAMQEQIDNWSADVARLEAIADDVPPGEELEDSAPHRECRALIRAIDKAEAKYSAFRRTLFFMDDDDYDRAHDYNEDFDDLVHRLSEIESTLVPAHRSRE